MCDVLCEIGVHGGRGHGTSSAIERCIAATHAHRMFVKVHRVATVSPGPPCGHSIKSIGSMLPLLAAGLVPTQVLRTAQVVLLQDLARGSQ